MFKLLDMQLRAMVLVMAQATALMASQAAPAFAADASPTAGPPLQHRLSAVGDPAMASMMDAWLVGVQHADGSIVRGENWRFAGDEAAIGALMFETADIAATTHYPLPADIAPYAHQFAGDMMKSPVTLQVGWRGDVPALLVFNKRPDSPLPPAVQAVAAYALSPAGQGVLARQPGFRPLDQAAVAKEAAKLGGFVAKLDGRLPIYRVTTPVHGNIRSVGSDGMKSLMERWMRDFVKLQPGVRRGDRWEHLGTLNGFNALLIGETDLAPMGRELWPVEAQAFASLHAGARPLEIRVARGGFNTQQRTTAQAVFVNAANPLTALTTAQLKGIFGNAPTITRWGQLGLTGEWADRSIVVDVPPHAAPNAMSMQMMALGGEPWNAAAHEGSVADTAKTIAVDPGAIGYGGFEDGGPGLRAVAIASSDAATPIAATPESASSGRYPLTRYMYIRLERRPGQPIPAPVREFLRYVLSRDAQEPILYSGYFPLSAAEAAQELAKLN